jgi:hypothetical protein
MTWRLWLATPVKGVLLAIVDRRAAARARALDHGGERLALVAVGLGRWARST